MQDFWIDKKNKKKCIWSQITGEIKILNVGEQKYQGFILSENGTNMKQNKAEQKWAIGIRQDINYLLRGQRKYTFKVGII